MNHLSRQLSLWLVIGNCSADAATNLLLLLILQVAREGTKKTVFTNFMDLCKAMNRNNEHVSAYLLAELGTSGSLDGQQRLVVKGRFLPKSFETVLRRYVNE
jgi:translation initiation factor 2 beta subunit (eIF-2beta)/eIF-5